MIWTAITDFGDLAVLAPAALIVLAWLGLTRRWRSLLAYGLSVGCCLGVTVVLKLLFLTGELSLAGVHSPSGHASASIAIYGGLAVLIGPLRRGWPGWAALASTAVLVAAIAVSRVSLHVHSVADVVLGSTIGLVSVALFLLLDKPQAPSRLELIYLLAALTLAVILLHGYQFPSSAILVHLAGKLS